MSNKSIIAATVAALAFTLGAKAQTNLQTFYDFGKDRGHVTTTLQVSTGTNGVTPSSS